jgi:hypothetical protein
MISHDQPFDLRYNDHWLRDEAKSFRFCEITDLFKMNLLGMLCGDKSKTFSCPLVNNLNLEHHMFIAQPNDERIFRLSKVGMHFMIPVLSQSFKWSDVFTRNQFRRLEVAIVIHECTTWVDNEQKKPLLLLKEVSMRSVVGADSQPFLQWWNFLCQEIALLQQMIFMVAPTAYFPISHTDSSGECCRFNDFKNESHI